MVGLHRVGEEPFFAHQVIEELVERRIDWNVHSFRLTAVGLNVTLQSRNRAARSTLRTTLKKIREMPEAKRAEAVNEIQSVLDKAANRGIIHRNKAARLKSRFKPAA
ncbi:MAG: 30S ribosomal protein S20 [bacterium]